MMKTLLAILLIFASAFQLCGQQSAGLKIYGLYRIPDEIVMGLNYHPGKILSLSFEAGYNLKFQENMEINGTTFGFEDNYALRNYDQGPVFNLGFNVHMGEIGFFSVSVPLKILWVRSIVTDTYWTYRLRESELSSLRTGVDLNYHLVCDRFTFYGGGGLRFAFNDFHTYSIDGEATHDIERKDTRYPVLNLGFSVTIKEWSFHGN